MNKTVEVRPWMWLAVAALDAGVAIVAAVRDEYVVMGLFLAWFGVTAWLGGFLYGDQS